MRRLWIGLLATLVVGCGGGQEMARSGVEDVDQTAAFLGHVVNDFRKAKRFNRASEMAGYMTSAMGKAEILPPHPVYESDAASTYRGPRPSDNVGVWADFWDTTAFEYYILVSGDDERGVVILDAYRMGDTCAFYRWEI